MCPKLTPKFYSRVTDRLKFRDLKMFLHEVSTVRGDQESIQLSGAYATRQQAEEGEKEEGTELDQIGGKGATQWGSKRGSLAAGGGVDTESSSTTADPGSTSSTLPSSPSHRWALSTGRRMRGG
jgi:hypothetical protein